MAQGDKIRFRQGTRSDVDSTAKQAGQLLFATYQDDVNTTSSAGTESLVQGDIYFDLSGGANGVRVKLANDVDKARTLFASTTSSADSPGQWTANVEGVTKLYDGLAVLLQINQTYNGTYNTLNINNLGNKLVWYKQGTRLTNQVPNNSELLLVYRTNAGSYTVPNSNPGLLTAGATYLDGWVMAYNSSDTIPSAITTTEAGAQIKSALCSNYKLLANSYIQLINTNANNHDGLIKLNINGQGAKDLYINGTISSSSNKNFPAGSYFVYYNGTNYYVRTDGLLPGPGIEGRATIANTADSLTEAGTLTVNLGSSAIPTYTNGGNITAGVSGVLPITKGGTGAANAEGARTNLEAAGLEISSYNPGATFYIKTDIAANNYSKMIYGYLQGNGYSSKYPIHVDFQAYNYREADLISCKQYDATNAIGAMSCIRADDNLIYFKVVRGGIYQTFKVFIYLHNENNGINHAVSISNTAPTIVKEVELTKIYGIHSGNIDSTNIGSATKLQTGRTLKVKLDSSSASTAFDGTANVHDIGVEGILPIGKGGTGASSFTSGALLQGNGADAISPASSKGSNKLPIYIDSDGKPQTIASYQGNAATASALNPGAKIGLSGGVTGTATLFTGATNITIPITTVKVGGDNITIDGTLAVSHGGTGATSLNSGALLQGNGAGAISAAGGKGNSTTPIYIDSNGKPQTISSYGGKATSAGVLDPGAKIGLSGGVTGTATLFTGGSDITIPITTVVVGDNNDVTISGKLSPTHGGTGTDALQLNATIVGNGAGAVKQITSKKGAYYSTANDAEPQFGTLPVSLGGTGETSIANIKAGKDGSGNTITSTYATKTELNNLIAAQDAMVFKGTIDSNSDIPATHNAGWTYKITTAGTYAGMTCEVGDLLICITDGTSANNAHWTVVQTNIDGAVTGPTTGTVQENTLAVFSNISGRVIKKAPGAGSSSKPIYIDSNGVAKEISSYSGNAATASALNPGAKIGLSGAVVGTATTFTGASDISIPVTDIYVGSTINTNVTVHGTLAVGYGGTGTQSLAANKVLIGNGADAIKTTALTADANGGLSTVASNTTGISYQVGNSNGKVSIFASTNRGLYDDTKSQWIIFNVKNGDHTQIPLWASKGSTTKPVYFNSSGEPAEVTMKTMSLNGKSVPIINSSDINIDTIAVPYGGTGATSLESGALLQGNGAFAISAAAEKGSNSLPIYIDSSGKPQTISSYEGKATTAGALDPGAKISISGGATAAGITFTGASDIALNITALDMSKATGTLGVLHGGTGKSSAFTAGHLIYAKTGTELDSTTFAHMNYTAGTTSVLGREELVLGNATASGTANNAEGVLTLYSAGTKGAYIKATSDSNWTTHYLPKTTGWIVTAGNGTNTGAGSQYIPVYVSEAGIATQVIGNKVLVDLASTSEASIYAESPRPGIIGNLPFTHGGTGADNIEGARKNLGIGNAPVYYGTCDTAAGTAQKDVVCSNYPSTGGPTVGDIILVKFANTNSAAVANLKLKVGAGIAANIKYIYNGSLSNIPGTNYLKTNQTYMFYYDGTYWVCLLIYNTNSDTTFGYCSEAAANATKRVSYTNYKLTVPSGGTTANPHYFIMTLVNTNTASKELLLNVNGQGAKPLYINGEGSSTDNCTLPAGVYVVYFEDNIYYINTDGSLPGHTNASSITGILPVNHGGTGTGNGFGADYALVGNGTGAIQARSQLQIPASGTITSSLPFMATNTANDTVGLIVGIESKSYKFGWHMGTGGVNHGLYDWHKNGTGSAAWVILGDASNNWIFNGNATSASKLHTAGTIKIDLASSSAVTYTNGGNITPGVTGTLPVGFGGTGAGSFTAGTILLGNGSDAIQAMSADVGSNVKPIYIKDGKPTAWDHEAAGAWDLSGAQDLNTKYDAGFYCIEGGNVSNYPANGTKYAAMIVVPYRKPSGNTTPDWGWQLATFSQDKDALWFRVGKASNWRGWRNIAHIAANTAVGDGSYLIYVDANGVVTRSTKSIGASDHPVWVNTGLVQAATVGDAFLSYGGQNFSANFSPLDALFNNKLRANRFAGFKPEGTIIQYSSDGGSTWVDSTAITDAQKKALFTTNTSLRLVESGNVTNNSQLRIIMDTGVGGVYTQLQKIMIYVSTSYSNNCTVTIDAALQNAPNNFTKVICTDQNIAGWSGWNIINIDGGLTTYGNTAGSQYGRIRLTFKHSSITSGREAYGLSVNSIYGYGGVGWITQSTLAYTDHVYSFDQDFNVTFPANVTTNEKFIGPVADYNNGTKTCFGYSTVGMDTTSWIASWDNSVSGEYRLRAISPAKLRAAMGLGDATGILLTAYGGTGYGKAALTTNRLIRSADSGSQMIESEIETSSNGAALYPVTDLGGVLGSLTKRWKSIDANALHLAGPAVAPDMSQSARIEFCQPSQFGPKQSVFISYCPAGVMVGSSYRSYYGLKIMSQQEPDSDYKAWLEVEGTLYADGQILAQSTTDAASTSSGSLIVSGGAGIAKKLYVGGATSLASTLSVSGATSLNSTFSVAGAATLNGAVTINNETDATTHTTDGALIVKGGVNVAKQLRVADDITLLTHDNDRAIVFGYATTTRSVGTTYTQTGASWRIVSLGSGSGDTNYFAIQSAKSTPGNIAWNNVIRMSMNTFDTYFGHSINPLATYNTSSNSSQNIGSSSYRWGGLYVNTGDFASNVTIGGTLGVTGVASFTNTTESTSTSSGAVKISGGLGVAKNAFIGGLLSTPGTRLQRIKLIAASATSQAAGWYRTCTVTSLQNYANFSVRLTGGWNNGAPTMALINIEMRNGKADIKVLHNGFPGRIQAVRLVKKETDTAYFEVYLQAVDASTSDLYASFEGNFSISDIITTNTVSTANTSDILATVSLRNTDDVDLIWTNNTNIELKSIWSDVGISGNQELFDGGPILTTGTYLIRCTYDEVIYSGICSWYGVEFSGSAGGTYYEIPLHASGKKVANQIYLRTVCGQTDGIKLQISQSGSTSITVSSGALKIEMKKLM